MYVPGEFAQDDDATSALLASAGAADLVTVTKHGMLVTYLPFVWEPSAGAHGSLLGHLARANDQWREPAVGDALVIVHGPDAYVTPSWYASSREHGRTVPTWDYETALVYGRLVVHDDAAWVSRLVRRLTADHERGRERPWSVDAVPEPFLAAQLRAIVGVEVVVGRVEAKAKWSQNRPPADVAGVIAGLEADGELSAAAKVRAARP